jgi:glutamate carboxypeptidase
MDTVFSPDHPFQTTKMLDANTLNGPGVADLKGGLVAMLVALEAFEQSPLAEKLGWEIIINPDEEIASHGSMPLLKEAAARSHVGFVYEPAFKPDGTLAAARKGNANIDIVVRGRAAHAGREFHKGRNAIVAAAEYTEAIFALNGKRGNVTINPGVIKGGSTSNTVPDLAILEVNVRVEHPEDERWVREAFAEIDARLASREGITIERHTEFTRPPKPFDEKQQKLTAFVQACGKELGQDIKLENSGGCCDGNNLYAFGLPNVDTLGVRGGAIHTENEYILLDSLAERASLSTTLLVRIAEGKLVL